MSEESKKPAVRGGLFRPILIVLVIALAAGIWYVVGRGDSGSVSAGTTFVVRRGDLDIAVLEKGTIEALESQEIRSRVEGREGVKILSIVEEGYLVTEEDVANGKILVELDSSQLEDQLQTQEMAVQGAEADYVTQVAAYELQLSENQSDIAFDKLGAKFALMDFHKFLGQTAVDDILQRLGLDKRAEIINAEIESGAKAEVPELEVSPVLAPQQRPGGESKRPGNWGPPEGATGENWGGREGAKGAEGQSAGQGGKRPEGRGNWQGGQRSAGGGERQRSRGASSETPVDPSIPAIPIDDEIIQAMSDAMKNAGMPADPERLKQMMSRSGTKTISPMMVSRMKEMGVDLVAIARDLGKLGGKPEAAQTEAASSIPTLEIDLEYNAKRNSLDFSEYADEDRLEDGEAKQQLRQLHDERLVADEELKLSKKLLEGQRRLAEKAFITQTDLELEEVKVQRNEIRLRSAQTAEELYIRYEFPKESERLLSDYEEALSELERSAKEAQAMLSQDAAQLSRTEQKFRIEKEELSNLQDQLEQCVILAERPGLVVYGSSTSKGGMGRYGSTSQEPIQEGTSVRERQLIITIPDMTKMGVNVSIHEAAVKRVLVGQKARLTIDANPDEPIEAEVMRVAVLPDSQNSFMNPDLKLYKTVLRIDGVIDWLRPGMSAQSEIMVVELRDILYVPIQAIVANGDNRYVYVAGGDQQERRLVETGEYTEEFIEIRSGLDDGDVVLLLPPALKDQSEYEPTDGMIEIPPADEAA